MNLDKVKKIADAVLYEGYILYPYRPSAIKNQQRWNFGTIYPRKFSEMQKGTDAWKMQTQCLVSGGENTMLDVKIRFLQIILREIFEPKANSELSEENFSESDFQKVQSLKVGGQIFQTWQEAVEREFDLERINLKDSVGKITQQNFSFERTRETEFLRDDENKIGGVILRKKETIEGSVEINVEKFSEELFKVTVNIFNQTSFEKDQNRDDALMRGFASTHTILRAENGRFVSLLDHAEELREAAASCENIGTFPVLVGDEGEREFLLSSPIILYDYPQVAPESAGDYFDGTEMDEMLALRIMTLTDEEKNVMHGADAKTRQMLERTETMPPELMLKLHGKTRDLSEAKGEK